MKRRTAMHPEAAYLQIFSPIGRANRKRVLLLHFWIFLLSNAYAIMSSMLWKLPSTFEE
uniref:Uncharacterized protein n=1 Tax=Colobus angolensis palliatus TaxID=336983 RepID=A0A2K5KE41_COLAP